jgi:putative tryptophan/tyrosine transport system substrate-binding protein
VRRRTFLTLLGASGAWPIAGIAQPSGAARRIGLIMPPFVFTVARRPMPPFLERMRELGWEAGRNIAYETRSATDEPHRLTEITTELVREKVDVIVVATLQMALMVRSVAPRVPIVVVTAGDPVRAGAAASLARPGGTITGLSLMAPELAVKRVEQLIELRPHAQRIAILQNPATPAAALMLEAATPAVQALGRISRVFRVSSAEAIDAALEEMARWGADGAVVLDDGLFFASRAALAAAAMRHKVPLVCPFREMALAGCLLSYSASAFEQFRRTADYVDKILRGANPGELPFEQPTRFELVVNVQVANALGIEVPTTLLAIADEVIE